MASFTRSRAAQACLALSLVLAASGLRAQQATPSTPVAAPNTLDAVRVNGRRNSDSVDPAIFEAAKSKVLSRNYASSCAFISGYVPAEGDVMRAYMRDFGLTDSLSNDAERIGENSLLSSKTESAATRNEREAGLSVDDPMASAAGCTFTDTYVAASRNRIARKDKSLTQAFAAYEAGNYTEARARFEEGWRKLGYEEAALMLGRLHLAGLGTPRSTPKAVEWLSEVINAPYHPVEDRLKFDPLKPANINTRVEAALLLARIYLTGLGTQRDPAQAYKWWSKALDYGFEPAGTLLAQAHLSGIGTKVDVKPALSYLQAAGEAGDVNALYMLGQLYHHQLPKQPDGVPLDLQRAGAYFGAAAKAGHLDATYAAARMMDLGEGASAPAPERALVLYKDAALKGHPDAQNALATFFYSGEGVPQNLTTARQLFQSAARSKQPDAMLNLAVMLAKGEGGDKDMVQAYAWCSLSKSMGNTLAQAPLEAIADQLTPQQRSRADALLKPTPGKS